MTRVSWTKQSQNPTSYTKQTQNATAYTKQSQNPTLWVLNGVTATGALLLSDGASFLLLSNETDVLGIYEQ